MHGLTTGQCKSVARALSQRGQAPWVQGIVGRPAERGQPELIRLRRLSKGNFTSGTVPLQINI